MEICDGSGAATGRKVGRLGWASFAQSQIDSNGNVAGMTAERSRLQDLVNFRTGNAEADRSVHTLRETDLLDTIKLPVGSASVTTAVLLQRQPLRSVALGRTKHTSLRCQVQRSTAITR
jgi:hypothetical protein